MLTWSRVGQFTPTSHAPVMVLQIITLCALRTTEKISFIRTEQSNDSNRQNFNREDEATALAVGDHLMESNIPIYECLAFLYAL